LEGSLLNGCRAGEDGNRQCIAEADGIAGEIGQIGERGGEIVDGLAIDASLGGGLGMCGWRDACGSGGRGALECSRPLVMVGEQHGRQRLLHVPGYVVGEHAEQHLATPPPRTAMMDWPDVEIGGFEAVEGALDLAEALLSEHDLFGGADLGGQVGANDIEPVEGGLGGDGILLARPRQGGVGDGHVEMLCHLVLVEHGNDGDADSGLAPQQARFVPQPDGNGGKQTLGGVELPPLSRPTALVPKTPAQVRGY
jgi:hypothetical protein